MTKAIFTDVKIMRADVPNGNKRTYPMAALEACVEAGKTKTIFGILGEPSSGTQLDIAQISHVVENLRITEDGYLVGNIQVLKTSQGDILNALVDEVQIDYRATGTGDVDENGVITNYTLISIDAVYDGAEL